LAETNPAPDEIESPPDIFRVGEVLSEMYEIRAVLGAGGMGQVFEAQDLALNRRVAIKAAWPNLEDSPVRKEAQALAAIRHPSMVGVFTVGKHAGIEYVVMERVFGIPLENFLYKKQTASEVVGIAEAIDLIIAIADGLAAVHHAGIAHRDVKPANIMLAPGGRVVLMDFGLFLPEFEVAAQSTIAGSPQYMAPEAISNTVEPGAGGLVDLYALGVVAYEMLCGVPPFFGETADEVWDKHLYDEAPDLLRKRPDAPLRLAQFVHDMLAKDPALRPQSADAALFQLRSIRAQVTQEPPFSVLIVEDDREIAKVLSFYVKKAAPDAEIRLAYDGQQAVDAVRSQAPDVMLLDLHLPRMNGIEVAMCLRGEGAAEKTTIVSLSAGAQERDLTLLAQLGVNHFVPKGAHLAEKVAAVIQETRKAKRGS
jgi:serine/threonine-protein kinase